MDLKGKSVLVTGSDGFIGSHLAEELVLCGAKVRAFVYYNSFNSKGWLDSIDEKISNEIEYFTGDIRDPHGVKASMNQCNIVFHLAALIGIPYSYHSPDTYIDTNIKGTLNVLQAARELNIDKIIHTSTSEVYGTAQYVPIDEIHPLQGQSPYSASKIGADQLSMSFYHSFKLPVTIIRPFNTYGPRQSARAVIPSIISQFASGMRRIKLGALRPTRDFNYVADTVAGFLAIAKAERSIGEIINIGSNYEISIGETAALIAKLMNINDFTICNESERNRPEGSEVERLWADNSKALSLLEWAPQFSGRNGFENGLIKTIDWFAQVDNLQRYKPNQYNI